MDKTLMALKDIEILVKVKGNTSIKKKFHLGLSRFHDSKR